MQSSSEINEIAAALAKAQGEFPKIAKNKIADLKGVSKRTGKEYSMKYSYADIADVLAAILPVLSKHNIAFIQPTTVDGGWISIHPRLIHSSGQWIGSVYPVCPINTDHQAMGSAITYSRRYAGCSLIGVAADDDLDDENTKDDTRVRRNGKDDAPRAAYDADYFPGDIPQIDEPFVSDKQIAELRARMAEVNADEQRFLRFMKVGGFPVMPAQEFDRAMAELNRKVPK